MAFRARIIHTLVQNIRFLRDREVSSTLRGPTKHVIKSRLQDLMTRILRMLLFEGTDGVNQGIGFACEIAHN